MGGRMSEMPKRIQRRRTKGWRTPENTTYVGRPTKWGNPFKIGDTHPFHGGPISRAESIELFREYLQEGCRLTTSSTPESSSPLDELRGRDLACWCPLTDAEGNRVPCHADVLLELANA